MLSTANTKYFIQNFMHGYSSRSNNLRTIVIAILKSSYKNCYDHLLSKPTAR